MLAFGSPMSLENSVSMGVIRSVGRQLSPDDARIFIQTDAPINPGNSGGALVDMNGQVVGLNTFILTKSGGSEGLGFAIPSNVIKYVFDQLKKDGYVHHFQVGIAARTITEPLAEALGLEPYRGALVEDVIPDSPAAKAGVQIGDVVESVGDRRIRHVRDLASSSYGYSIGDVARLQVLFGPKAAARYLGICEDTLKKITDLGQLRAFNMNGRRAYRLEDLDAYVESLPGWYDSTGEKSAKVVGRQESLMIFEEIEKRSGRKFIVGSKYWPDGTRFRRRFSNKTLAKSVLGGIEGAIAMGTWKELRKELAGEEEQQDYTIREFVWRSWKWPISIGDK